MHLSRCPSLSTRSESGEEESRLRTPRGRPKQYHCPGGISQELGFSNSRSHQQARTAGLTFGLGCPEGGGGCDEVAE